MRLPSTKLKILSSLEHKNNNYTPRAALIDILEVQHQLRVLTTLPTHTSPIVACEWIWLIGVANKIHYLQHPCTVPNTH